jgi:uncharacterized protein
MLMPSEWYPLLLGEGTFDSRDEAERITGLLTRRYNEILSSLSRHREDHPAPSLGDEALAEWCRGYIEAARGDSAWMNDEPAVLQLFKFSFLAGEVDLVGEENDKGEVIEDATEYERRYRRGLPAQVLCNHQYWVERRRAEYVPSEPAVTSKVGRNDPCPCGSGRKYKRCCLG